MGDSAFDMSEMLESINGGVDRYDMQQLFPISGNVTNQVVGQGNASGLSTFQWQDSANWWSPCQSYFSLILTFKAAGAIPSAAQPLTYADNFVMTLFSQLQLLINSKPLDVITTPHITDTALEYSGANKNFLETWGSLTRIGEPLSTRLINVQSNGGQIEVVFRPPISLFDVKLLPPGAQFTLHFNWANNGINAFESLYRSVSWNTSATDTTANTVCIVVSSFSFYKASMHASPSVPLPQRGVIDLMPCQALQYFLNGGAQLRQNITLPPTTNRVLVVFQDVNTAMVTTTPPVDYTCGVGSGYNPATSFSNVFTTSNAMTNNQTFTTNTTSLTQLWLSLPELGINEPSPVYNFTSGLVQDYMRAYSDWCHITQGTHSQHEGSIPFGTGITGTNAGNIGSSPSGVTIVHLDNVTPANNFAQVGDPNNRQQYTLFDVSATIPAAKTYNQTGRYGWFGRNPGPIFAFPVVRPQGRTITTGTLFAYTGASVTGISATIIASYSMALALELQPNGYYLYTVIEGV